MSDDALDGSTDTSTPWTIPSIAIETRRAAVAAARAQGVTVGQ